MSISIPSLGAGAPIDPDYASVVSLWRFIGTSGSGSPFVQDCAAGTGITDNATGALLSNSQSPFGGTSLRCSSAGTDFAVGGANATTYAFGTGDCCVEFWARTDSATPNQVFFDMRNAGQDTALRPIIFQNNGVLTYYYSTAARITSGAGVIVSATWQHIAWARVSGTSRLFVDGVQVGSFVDAGNFTAGSGIGYFLGTSSFSTGILTGNIGPGRITKGVGRYSANFTRPGWIFPMRGP